MTKEEFKDIRMQYGFTQEEFGEVLGLSKSGVSNIENGTRAINKKHIRLIEYFMTLNKPDYKVTLGRNIKAARKAKKMTQPQLAALIDKHESSIRKYEKGLTDIPNEVIQKIAEVLDTTPGKLLGIIEEKEEPVDLTKISTKELLNEIERRCKA